MKLAWLCYSRDESGVTDVQIMFSEPYDRLYYYKVVPIVYAHIVD